MEFKGKSPCKDCPYRIDAPLQKWDKGHFRDSLKSESDYMGSLYHCHKNNGSVCRGWLMDQDNNRFPSIALRLELSRKGITREYLDKLHCESALYESVRQMAKANFPELIKNQ